MTAFSESERDRRLRFVCPADLAGLPVPKRLKRFYACIETCTEPVQCRGDPLSEMWWRGKEWAVTEYGIERLDGRYAIAAARLVKDENYLWPEHMNNKEGSDIDDFTTAWMIALLLHGYAYQLHRDDIRRMFGRLRPLACELEPLGAPA